MTSSFRASTAHLFATLGLAMIGFPGKAQLILNQTLAPDALVQNHLLGGGVFPSNIMFNGRPGNVVASVGVTSLSEIGRFNGANTCLGLANGIFLCTHVAQVHLPGPNDQLNPVGGGTVYPAILGVPTPDLDLSRLTGWEHAESSGGNNICNKAILEFDFVPINDMICFRYVFSSEEYERWACSRYNDVFGWFLSGPGISGPFTNNAMNIAFIPGSMSPVSINTVNSGRLDSSNANGPDTTDLFRPCFDADPDWQANAQYYRYNGGKWRSARAMDGPQLEAPYNTDPYYIAHNGMTVVLTASAAVLIGETYHMKMAVGNAFDGKYPSAVFIERGSLKSADRFNLTVDEGANVTQAEVPLLHQSNTDSIHLRFNRWGGFYLDEYLKISVEGDAVAGVDYLPALPDSIHFNQLDSAVVLPLAVPVHADRQRELVINLITSNGNKVRAYRSTIDQPRIAQGVGSTGSDRNGLSLFPNPAVDILHVGLPEAMQGITDLQVLDASGRVVLRQVFNGGRSTTIDLSALPAGLYTVKAESQGKLSTARVNVRH
ncbi:MAG: choice-of-anchor L domain-containing protein [Flavobacteriales bacterium]